MAEGVSSGWYLYGVVGGPLAPVPVTGMDGNPLESWEHGGLAVVTTAIVLPRPPGRRRDLMSHSDVLNAIAAQQDVIPLRLGTVVEERESLTQRLLGAEHDLFVELLARVADCVQLNVRVSYVRERVLADVVTGDPEIRRLHERTRGLPDGTANPDLVTLGRMVSNVLTVERQEDGAAFADALLPFVVDSRVRDRGDVDHVLDMAMLVDRSAVSTVEAQLESLAEEVHERMRVELVGPLAPFDFVEDVAWA